MQQFMKHYFRLAAILQYFDTVEILKLIILHTGLTRKSMQNT